MAGTVMIVEFGTMTIYIYSSLDKNSKSCLCTSLNRYKNKEKKITEHYVNYDFWFRTTMF